MEILGSLAHGFAVAVTPVNLFYCFLGALVGTAIGVLPGLGPPATIALLLPVTYGMPPTSAVILLAGIFYGAMYGGSTTSILLNTPGESASIITALEGNKMARSGRGGPALATAAIGSFVAGTIGTALLVLVMPQVVAFAINLGSPELFAIIMVAFVGASAVLGSSRVRGFASLLVGLTIGVVGIDFVTGQQRLTFGIPQLADGIDIIIVAVGIFAVGEALWVAAHLRRKAATVIPVGRPWMGRDDRRRSWKPWLRGTAFGFPFGAIPAGGAEIPTFLSYLTERRLSKHPEEFGKGAIEGVAGPEAANNASAAGTMVPLLALGLPTNATAAIIIAAVAHLGLMRTSYGAILRGSGGNPQAIRRAGWSLLKAKVTLYTLAGLFGVASGMALIGTTTSADANIGNGYTLLSIAGVILDVEALGPFVVAPPRVVARHGDFHFDVVASLILHARNLQPVVARLEHGAARFH